MKKSIFLFFALVAGAINLFADECVKTPTTLKGTASVIFTRYEHKNLTGAFAVSNSGDDTTYVAFSQGNLQYQASTDTWRFAEHQYDTVGLNNKKISSTYRGWIDLFGYGTSGASEVNGGSATSYQPWSVSDNDADYAVGGNSAADLNGSYAEADWAYHNAIINGGLDADGGVAHTWRVLKRAEWTYLFETRINATDLYGFGSLMGVNGLFLLPDGFSWTDATVAAAALAYGGFTFTAGTGAYTSNVIDKSAAGAALWDAMENKGVVFLPVTGRRNGSSMGADGYGMYWSSTHQAEIRAWILRFGSNVLNYPDDNSSKQSRHYGFAVRPVHVLGE